MTVTADNILAMGFSSAMYGIDAATLTERINSVIADQSGLIEVRVGASAFLLPANARAIDQAVKCKAAAEMARRRIVALSANAMSEHAERMEALNLERAIKDWEDQAEQWIVKVVDGSLADAGGFASGVCVSESAARMSYPES